MIRICLLLFIFSFTPDVRLYLPVKVGDRTNSASIKLTGIGQFGLQRKARPTVPAHYHTGIDIIRPSKNYTDEPVYAAGKGKVISMRNDGPFSQIIIEHKINSKDTLWTVYEHILGIVCHTGDMVNENSTIARFFNKAELDKYGWQFDHLHFEIMKKKPLKLKATVRFPEYFYKTYAINCFSKEQLNNRMINPYAYFRKK